MLLGLTLMIRRDLDAALRSGSVGPPTKKFESADARELEGCTTALCNP
jgi:hypothetical protein